jgi:hypothetical protein
MTCHPPVHLPPEAIRRESETEAPAPAPRPDTAPLFRQFNPDD